MKQRIILSLIATFIYFVIANLGNLVFSVTEGIGSTLWESLFFFLFIFLLLGYRNNNHKK
ncbi:hypothetical protein ACSFB8_01190 [Enterococcus faecalis]